MRVPQVNRQIALHGASCTGKTSIAVELGIQTGVAVRHCGRIARERARMLGLESPGELPDNEHAAIDTETRKLATTEAPMIMEGRFLDQVLSDCQRVVFVHLTCDSAIRQERLQASMTDRKVDSIHKRDEDDADFRAKHYRLQLDAEPTHFIALDTSKQSVSVCVATILRYLDWPTR